MVDEDEKNAEIKRAEIKKIKTLRINAINTIDNAINTQGLHWDNLETDIAGAEGEYNGRQHQLLWDGLEKVANPNSYPLWMDIILNVAAMTLPVNAFVAYAGKKILFSQKLLGIPVERDKFGKLVLQESFVGKNVRDILLKQPDVWKSFEKKYETWVKVGQTLGPEIVANFRTIIRTAAQTAIRPLFDNEQMTNWMTKSQKPSFADNTGLPSVDVLTGMRKWINRSRYHDKTILTNLKTRIEKECDELVENEDNILLDPGKKLKKECKEAFLTEIEKYINEESGITEVPRETGTPPPYQQFQRFVEACLWCTTYDFTPKLVPWKYGVGSMKREPIDTPAHWKLLPFSKAFWDNLITRHYDPFFGDGTKTYKDIGPNTFIAPGDKFTLTPMVIQELPKSYPVPDPATRLSFQWSLVLSPALLNENTEAASLLLKYFP